MSRGYEVLVAQKWPPRGIHSHYYGLTHPLHHSVGRHAFLHFPILFFYFPFLGQNRYPRSTSGLVILFVMIHAIINQYKMQCRFASLAYTYVYSILIQLSKFLWTKLFNRMFCSLVIIIWYHLSATTNERYWDERSKSFTWRPRPRVAKERSERREREIKDTERLHN